MTPLSIHFQLNLNPNNEHVNSLIVKYFKYPTVLTSSLSDGIARLREMIRSRRSPDHPDLDDDQLLQSDRIDNPSTISNYYLHDERPLTGYPMDIDKLPSQPLTRKVATGPTGPSYRGSI